MQFPTFNNHQIHQFQVYLDEVTHRSHVSVVLQATHDLLADFSCYFETSFLSAAANQSYFLPELPASQSQHRWVEIDGAFSVDSATQ